MAVSPPALPEGSATPPRTSGLAITSLVLGILSCPFSFLAGIPGLICGIIGLSSISRSERGGVGPRLTGRGMALAGTILSALGTLSAPLLVALLLPAIQAARNAARNVETSNNVKQIAMAMYMAQDAIEAFPAGIVDADGKPLLSWRVAILPGLGDEGKQLFNEFHLDEPWDSDHNKTLIPRMPAVFAASGAAPGQGLTGVVLPAGPGMAFGEADGAVKINAEGSAAVTGVKPGSIKDGMSNTVFIMVIPGVEVPWTKPADYTGDPAELFAALRKEGVSSVLLGTADAAVRPVPTDVDPEVVRAFFSRAGGESTTNINSL